MRLGRYVLAEAAIAAALFIAAGFAAQRGLSALGRHMDARTERMRKEAIALPTRKEEVARPLVAIPPRDDGAVFLGMSDELLLDRLRTQPIVRAKLNRGGSSLSFRIDLGDGSRAAFKPAQTNLQTIPRKEVAAYRINRLLGLAAVPPAAPRLVTSDELLSNLHPDSQKSLPRIRSETLFNPLGKTVGVAMYWIPEIKDSKLDIGEGLAQSNLWLTQGNTIPSDKSALAAQVSNMRVFDFVISNPDRYSGGNMLMSPDGSSLFFMDNTLAFFLDPSGNEKTGPPLRRTQRFSRRLFEALPRLTAEGIAQAFAAEKDSPYEILTPSEVRTVVSRREAVQRHISDLFRVHGENNVLCFP